NEARKAWAARQARGTWKGYSSENAGPAGKVVDQALEASEIAVASFTETLTTPATRSCCITPLIATSDARDAMMTITTTKALAWLSLRKPSSWQPNLSLKTMSSTMSTRNEAPQRSQRMPDCIVI